MATKIEHKSHTFLIFNRLRSAGPLLGARLMASKFFAVIAVLTFAPSVFAIDIGTLVTKDSSNRLGLHYELSAVQASAGAVIVALSVEKKEKLSDLKRVQLQVSDGKE